MRRIQIRPGADQDLDEVADHYAEVGGLDLALRFLESVQETWDQLREYPEIGQTCLYADPRLEGIRRWHVRAPFEMYLVFYRIVEDEALEIVRVLHGARDLPRHLSSADS